MEEVDGIVIHTLRQIGCEIDDDIFSLRQFSTDLVISGVVRCLKLISPTLDAPHNVPPGMSARYRLGAALASECTLHGYKGEIGYQTFLYSNETDLRKVFLFLIEKLPKESEKVSVQPLSKFELVQKETSEYFKECLITPWLPYYCLENASHSKKIIGGSNLVNKVCHQAKPLFIPFVDKTWTVPKQELHTSHYNHYFKPVVAQVQPVTTLLCSVLEENEKQFVCGKENEDQLSNHEDKLINKLQLQQKAMTLLAQAVQKNVPYSFLSPRNTDTKVKGSRFAHALELQFANSTKNSPELDTELVSGHSANTEEEKRKMREEEISSIQLQIDEILSKIDSTELENKKLESSMEQIANMMNVENKKTEGIKEEYRVKKCTMSLLPDAENNVMKLKGLIDASTQRLASLAAQWEQHRVPLVEKYKSLQELSSQRQTETQQKLENIKQMQEKIQSLGTEARSKDEIYKQLIVAYEKLTKDLNRSAYTRRIMEIVGNIKKQKQEIDKILLDTRNVQKEINRLSGKLERTFTVTDELIFRDAKKDESVRRAYKLLAALHENCSQLIQIIEETGFIVREVRELEDHIEQENQKKITATLERINSDFKQMQQENTMLIAQLKKNNFS